MPGVGGMKMLSDPVKARIAQRVAQELPDKAVVNLGVGIPTLVTGYVPKDKTIFVQSENGLLGVGPLADKKEADVDLIDASRNKVTLINGGSIFDSAASFAMIRGGHLDVAIIGALEVSERGDLANWSVPSKGVYGVGGAMDLVCGCKKVIVAIQHVGKDGKSKILRECTLPLTAVGVVDTVVTEFAVFKFIGKKMYLTEHTSDIGVEKLRTITEGQFVVSGDMKIRKI
ncbi:MAG: 3-oxoacid CoA-transferase subunit B [Acidaminococcales bacterium]|jgi:3-oxoacid CoA-transferase B subunit|nr:3-oxoacid CoA-transferase subunit B [Acidaminococcales bacterium]